MIVKMKKYVFLVYHKHYTDFLEKLRKVGVLHVAEKAEGIADNDQLRDKMQLSAKIKKNSDRSDTIFTAQHHSARSFHLRRCGTAKNMGRAASRKKSPATGHCRYAKRS